MNLTSFYTNRVCISEEAKKGGRELVFKMKNNLDVLDTLPNSYENYTGKLEVENYLSFCDFLNSRRGKKIMQLLKDGE